MAHIISGPGGRPVEITTTGTTTASYVTAVDIDMRGRESGVGVIYNTGVTNTMFYKVLGEYAKYAKGELNEIVAETSLAVKDGVGDRDFFRLENAYARILVQVKNNAGATTYTVDRLENKL